MEPNQEMGEGFSEELRNHFEAIKDHLDKEIEAVKRLEPIALASLKDIFDRFEVNPALMNDSSNCKIKGNGPEACGKCSQALACALLRTTTQLLRAKETFFEIAKIVDLTGSVI